MLEELLAHFEEKLSFRKLILFHFKWYEYVCLYSNFVLVVVSVVMAVVLVSVHSIGYVTVMFFVMTGIFFLGRIVRNAVKRILRARYHIEIQGWGWVRDFEVLRIKLLKQFLAENKIYQKEWMRQAAEILRRKEKEVEIEIPFKFAIFLSVFIPGLAGIFNWELRHVEDPKVVMVIFGQWVGISVSITVIVGLLKLFNLELINEIINRASTRIKHLANLLDRITLDKL